MWIGLAYHGVSAGSHSKILKEFGQGLVLGCIKKNEFGTFEMTIGILISKCEAIV